MLIVYNNSDDMYVDSEGKDVALEGFIEKTVIPYIKKYSSSDKGYIYCVQVSHYPEYGGDGDHLGIYAQSLELDIKDYNSQTIEDILYASLSGHSGEEDGVGILTFDRLIYLSPEQLKVDLPELKLYTIDDYEGEYQDGEKIGEFYWNEVEYNYSEEVTEEANTNEE